jgi:hypothetical protein
MEDAVREQGGHGDRLEHRLKQRLMREPWHPSTLSSKLGKAEILARSIIKNGPITNSKRRPTDIEKGPVFREAATIIPPAKVGDRARDAIVDAQETA